MNAAFTKITAVISSVFILLGLLIFPDKTEGLFPPEHTAEEKQSFDEGEFSMNSFDIVVAPNGSDNNPGTLELPLKTPEAAKEKAKTLKGVAVGTVTVYSRPQQPRS